MKAEDPTPRPPCPYVMIPVPKEDFKRVNELAEAYWIASDPDNKQAIKELRRNLLKKVNPACPSTSVQTSVSLQHNKEVIAALMERDREARQENK